MLIYMLSCVIVINEVIAIYPIQKHSLFLNCEEE